MTSSNRLATRVELHMPERHLAAVRRWAVEGYPREACGLLMGIESPDGLDVREVRRARNLEPERARDRYVLDPAAFYAADRDARAAGQEIVGFWHTHPDSAAVPSRTDLDRAWPGYAYLIVSTEAGAVREIRVWRLVDGTFEEGRVIR